MKALKLWTDLKTSNIANVSLQYDPILGILITRLDRPTIEITHNVLKFAWFIILLARETMFSI